MLVIGGFKYITAAGNPAAASEGKEIIRDAGLGMILALLSWVIISTLNPDVLYIKQPGNNFQPVESPRACVADFNSSTKVCTCKDGNTITAITSIDACNTKCSEKNFCNMGAADISCIKQGTPNDVQSIEFVTTFESKCTCVDGVKIDPSLSNSNTCNDACQDPGSFHCGVDKFLRIKIDSPNELWEFFLPDEAGAYDVFDIAAKEYVVGGNTYNCAIMLTEETTLLPDENTIVWVKDGTKIDQKKPDGSNAATLREDLGAVTTNYVICSNFTSLPCRINTARIATVVLDTNYVANIASQCQSGKCDLANSINDYFPKTTIECVVTGGEGKWVVQE